MKKSFSPILFTIGLLISMTSCSTKTSETGISQNKKAILSTEKEFEICVRNEGLAAAFTKFADDSAVINRNDSLIKGKQGIGEFYQKRKKSNSQLSWDADFVDVSVSGDFGYTYGNYTFSVVDSFGGRKEYKGIFHTVWKKQTDNSWKYVWD
jgi:ketosteroid isomerase-like protein